MVMTNYMDLLASNQPWNLILFMVIPVVLAEALVATEFFALYLTEEKESSWHTWNKYLGIAAGLYFTWVFIYLITQVIPSIEWRGYADVIAIVAYLSGIVPLLSITLLELGVWGKNLSEHNRTKKHFILLIVFLVINHVAMVFGMVNPEITGWQPKTQQHQMMMHSSDAANEQDMSAQMPMHDNNKHAMK